MIICNYKQNKHNKQILNTECQGTDTRHNKSDSKHTEYQTESAEIQSSKQRLPNTGY